ncbi:MAG: cobalamin B12-binding domain-containing protein [Thermodesulfobacteriota bacterium]
MADLEGIKEAVIKGKRKLIPQMVQDALDEGVDPHLIINDYMIEALKVVGDKFESKKIFVPEMMISAKAMQAGLDVVKPVIEASEGNESKLGTVAIGTVFGDMHDIGKNLVILMLESSGFKVYNIGENVSPEDFVAKAKELGADVVGMSSLLTTGDPYVQSTVEALKSSDLQGVKVICGGAAVTEKFAVQECGADGYAQDAVGAVRVVKELLNIN